MPERRTIDDRLSALERRLTERGTGAEEPTGPGLDTAEPTDEPDTTGSPDVGKLAERVETLEAEIAELEAGLQALRGYVGNVEHVNESVERRANAAIAAVERLESAPKTPPPIATATPAGRDTGEPADQPEQADVSPDRSDSEGDDVGILDRLMALR